MTDRVPDNLTHYMDATSRRRRERDEARAEALSAGMRRDAEAMAKDLAEAQAWAFKRERDEARAERDAARAESGRHRKMFAKAIRDRDAARAQRDAAWAEAARRGKASGLG